MKVVLSAIFLVLSLVCGVQGQAECVQEEYDDFWEGGSGPMLCGCQLYDPSDTPLVNISLDFFDTKYVRFITIVVTCAFRLNTEQQTMMMSHILTLHVRAIPVVIILRR